MKPTHRIFCRDCGRPKILFDTELKALNFIKFNNEEIIENGGKKLRRAYYCPYCCGYHVTSSRQYREGILATSNVLDAYEKSKSIPKTEEIIEQPEKEVQEPKIIQQVASLITPELKEERNKMRNLYREIKELLEFYTDKSNILFIEALKLEKEAFDTIQCDNIKTKTNVETILKQYLNYD